MADSEMQARIEAVLRHWATSPGYDESRIGVDAAALAEFVTKMRAEPARALARSKIQKKLLKCAPRLKRDIAALDRLLEEVEAWLADDDISIIAVRQARLKLISALEEVERRQKYEAPKKTLIRHIARQYFELTDKQPTVSTDEYGNACGLFYKFTLHMLDAMGENFKPEAAAREVCRLLPPFGFAEAGGQPFGVATFVGRPRVRSKQA